VIIGIIMSFPKWLEFWCRTKYALGRGLWCYNVVVTCCYKL